MNIFFRSIFCLLLLTGFNQSAYSQSTENSDQIESQSSSFANSEYILSPGDIVSVTVFGEPDISSDNVRVPLAGTYDYPLIGDLEIIGQTTASLAMMIEKKLRAGFISDPQVSVNIVSYRPVIVSGAIDRAGKIEYQEGMTLRILSALAQINTNNMDLTQVEIQRNSERFHPVTLDDLILPGDIVSYSVVHAAANYYYIYGEVIRSGRYPFEDGLSIEKAIIVAGGYTPFASKRNVTVRRDSEEKPMKIKLHEPVMPGDVITVKKRWF